MSNFLGAGTNHIGQVGGAEKIVAATPVLTAGTAYTAKDAVGGKLTFANVIPSDGLSGILQAVTVIDKDSEAAELMLVLFNQDFTASTNEAAFDPSDADLANVIAKVTIAASDYTAFNDNSVAQVRNLGLPFTLAGTTTSISGQMMCTGTPTYTATSDLIVKLHIMLD